LPRLGFDPLIPMGTVIYAGRPHTPRWFEARKEGITATDLPAIVGAYDAKSVWGRTPLHVYLDKRGELPDEGHNAAAEAGLRMEPVIAKWWGDDHGVTTHATGIVAKIGDMRWRCSPDRVVNTCPDGEGPCGLEIKTRSAYVSGQWKSDVPDDVLAQVAWTMLVCGWRHMHVAALIGGNNPRWHRVDREEVLEQYLIDAAEDMWQRITTGNKPEVDPGAALSRLLDALHPNREGVHTLDKTRAQELRELYAEGSSMEYRGKRLKDRARDELLALIGDAEEAWVDDGEKPLATYRLQSKTTLPVEQMKRLRTTHPALYSQLMRENFIVTTESRALRWARSTEDKNE
jgi:putative phage-type endonuclease